MNCPMSLEPSASLICTVVTGCELSTVTAFLACSSFTALSFSSRGFVIPIVAGDGLKQDYSMLILVRGN